MKKLLILIFIIVITSCESPRSTYNKERNAQQLAKMGRYWTVTAKQIETSDGILWGNYNKLVLRFESDGEEWILIPSRSDQKLLEIGDIVYFEWDLRSQNNTLILDSELKPVRVIKN